MPEHEENIPSREIILGYLSQLSGFSLNVKQEHILITEDKLYIHLNKTVENLERRCSWTTPLGIFLSLLLAVLNANFKDTIFAGSIWKAIFIIGVIVSGGWLVIVLKKRGKAETIDQIIERIKKEPR
jgi:uncharacterized protein (UPF0210 family)